MKLIALLAAIGLVGCEYNPQAASVYKGSQFHTVCIDGIAYIKWSTYSIAPKIRPDGTQYICVDTDIKVIVK